MICSSCRADNPPIAKFCRSCGARLQVACPACRALNPARAKFCGQCGASLAVRSSASAPADAILSPHVSESIPPPLREKMSASEPIGERRRVSILFADVKGFTTLSERLDPEVVYHLMSHWSKTVAACIYEFEGYVDKFIGDEVMALFGAPVAHEDDPERAIRAGLRMQEAMREINREAERKWGVQLPLRVGIHAGLVVAGGMGADARLEYTVMGDVVNAAARLQGQAEPGSILVSDPVRQETRRAFDFGPAQEISLRGRTQPILAFTVLGLNEAPDAPRGLDGFSCPLIGRERGIAALRETLEEVITGKGRIFFLVGEAGLGKSRLIREIRRDMETRGVVSYLGRCISYGMGAAYLPIHSALLRLLDASDDDDDETLQARAKEACASAPGLSPTAWPALGIILRRDWKRGDIRTTDPKLRRQLARETFLGLLLSKARHGPIALILEDLHWADQESLDLLEFILPRLEDAPIFFIAAYRPDVRFDGSRLPGSREYLLRPLTNDEMTRLITGLLANSEFPEDFIALLLSKSEGNPFYLEELIRALIETGILKRDGDRWILDRPAESIELPSSLHALVLARLDRLSESERRVLQKASVIGRNFSLKVLEHLEESAAPLAPILAELQRHEFIYERSGAKEREFAFRQTVTQEAAYQTLLLSTRRRAHGETARSMETLYRSRIEEYLPLIAHHYMRSDDSANALKYSVLSGDQAARAYALAEMRAHYEDALKLLEEDGATDQEKKRFGTHIQETLADAHFLAGEYPQASERYLSSIALCGSDEDEATGPRRRAALHRKRAVSLHPTGQAEAAIEELENSRKCLEANADRWRTDMGAADAWLSWLRVKQGRLDEGTERAEDALASLRTGGDTPDWNLPFAISGNHRLKESARGLAENALGLAALFRCRWAEAEIHCNQALEQFEAAGDLAFYAGVLANLATVHQSRARYAKARDCASRSLAIVEKTGFVMGQIVCHCSLGYTYMVEGEYRSSLPHLRRALELTEMTGDLYNIAESRVNLALWAANSGEIEGAEAHLDEARRLVEAGDDPGFDASLEYARGSLLLSMGRAEEALTFLEIGLDASRRAEATDTEIQALAAMVSANLDLRNYETSKNLLNEILSRSVEDLPEAARAKSLRLRGRMEREMSRYDESERWLSESRRLADSLSLRHEFAQCGIEMGMLHLATGRIDLAQREWRANLSICREIGAAGDTLRLERLLASFAPVALPN